MFQNEFEVLLTGVYMQIIRKGIGKKLNRKDWGNCAVPLQRRNTTCWNLDSTMILTNIFQYIWMEDKMNVTSIIGHFYRHPSKGSSLMY